MRLEKLALFLVVLTSAATLFAASDVTLAETDNAYTLDNGLVTARISKRSGDLISLRYKNLELLDSSSGHGNGYWSHDIAQGRREFRTTLDPKSNRGARGEVSLKGYYTGQQLGANSPGGGVIADVEIRYALGRNDSGIYTYSIFSHPTNYPGTSLGEARFCAKLNDAVFDWMTVDANRNMQLITAYDWNHGAVMNMKEARRMNSGIYKGQVEHKYDYSANQFETPAWGWSSTTNKVGLWFVNPSVEYLSGGPTKVELSAHRDATFNTNALNAPAAPTLLNYWRGSHYGGSICNVAQGEEWTKVIGPFMIYCNAGATPAAMWKDALAKAAKEAKAWPFEWVEGVDYPHHNERATVKGQLLLKDPQAASTKLPNLLVGLAAPDYLPARVGGGGRGGPGGFGVGPAGGGEDEAATTNQTNLEALRGAGNSVTNLDRRGGLVEAPVAGTNDNSSITGTNALAGGRGRGRGRGRGGPGGGGFNFAPRPVTWQNDAKHYEFWVRGDANGKFTIPEVRPGTYTLHAIADGVLGELAVSNIVVTAGKPLDLGKVNWQPVRYGKQIWDIGIPNRKGSEFFKGDDYFHWGWYLEYPKLFPQDVNYVVGKSNFKKDWFFEQVPHNENPNNLDGRGTGRATPWSITFNLPKPMRGVATLRLAIPGIGTGSIGVALNGGSLGTVTGLPNNSTLSRDGITGLWVERNFTFDASLMKAGENKLTLTVPAGGLASGIIYDYLRLEVDESATVTAQTATR